MIEPLRVTAELANGFVAFDPWTPSLENVLAYWELRQRLGEEEFALRSTGIGERVEPELPLGAERDGDLWWWQCSSPLYEQVQEYRSYHHRRFDAQAAETYLVAPKGNRQVVLTSAGPLKNYRVARTVHLVPRIVWHCLGDADDVRRLLRRCTSLGAGRNTGRGLVREWLVEGGGDPELARLHRPLPVEFAATQGVTGMALVWGVRPDVRDPEHRALCVMP